MIVAFDLDDTLYPEIDYVHSGFKAAATELEARLGVSAERSYALMIESLEQRGRGTQFDDMLLALGLHTKDRMRWLLHTYRHHLPALRLPTESHLTLSRITAGAHALYLVTDGHKVVQANKIAALGLAPRFRHCYLTSRYGRAAAKPASRVFELVLKREWASPDELVYIGDDPNKDFVGVSRLGGRTVRVRTGRHAQVAAECGYDADVTIPGLGDLPDLIETWAQHPPSLRSQSCRT